MQSLPLSLARRIAVESQLLGSPSPLLQGKEGAAEVIQRLGYIQIDTIAVVERAHHISLRSRVMNYRPEMLRELQATDRRIFEYWGHEASYLPLSDYRFYLPLKKAYFDPIGKWEKDRLNKCKDLMPMVLERIRQEGPLGSADFQPAEGKKTSNWWGWHPLKTALELLFWQGELMIVERRNFHRIYEITERALPPGVDTTMPDDEELGRFLTLRALSAHGLARMREIVKYLRISGRGMIYQAIADLEAKGEIERYLVEGCGAEPYYALPAIISRIAAREADTPSARILSPFDNLVINRRRLQELFAFDYAIECYVPAPKRVFGYFTHLILWGYDLVGRLDPKADHKSKTLKINNLALESGFTPTEAFLTSFADQLAQFARFHDCLTIKLPALLPAKAHKLVIKLLKKAGMEV